MSHIDELLAGGELKRAVAEVTDAVRRDPVNSRLRTALFEMLLFAGDLARARKLLETIVGTDATTGQSARAYADALLAEDVRREVFEGRRHPDTMLEAPSWLASWLAAPRAANHWPVFPETTVSGDADGTAFTLIRDADDRIAGVVEVVAGTKYFWVPFEQIREISLRPSERLRSRYWRDALLRLRDGTSHGVFLPALYVDSWTDEDDRVRLGHLTRWRERGDGFAAGVGARLWLFDSGDLAVLEAHRIAFAEDERAPAGEAL